MEQNNQLSRRSALPQLSQKLILSILKLESPDLKFPGKMELMEVVTELMPAGVPDFLSVVKYQKISALKTTLGQKDLHKAVFLLVKDFCSSLNVVRNMNEDQMIEAAAMLLDECGNFRLEDYTMMFALAKRGGLVKLYDRIDLEVITAIIDAYWVKRHKAAIEAEEKAVMAVESQIPTLRSSKPDDFDKVGNLGGAMSELKIALKEKVL